MLCVVLATKNRYVPNVCDTAACYSLVSSGTLASVVDTCDNFTSIQLLI